MDKSIWPTNSKIERLKALGLLPISTFFTAVVVCLGVLGLHWFFRAEIRELVVMRPVDQVSILVWIGLLAKVLVVSAAACLALTIFSALLQTKFHFRLANLNLDAGRLSWAEFKRRRVVGFFTVLFSEIFALLIVAVLFFNYVGDFFLIMRFGAPQWLVSIGAAVLPSISSGMFLLALISLIVVRLFFRLRHRMDVSEWRREMAAGDNDDEGRVDAVS